MLNYIYMKIEHIAIWVKNLDNIKNFYETFFEAKSSELYYNKNTGFKSYFIKFNNEIRLELMSNNKISKKSDCNSLGYAHISISLGSKEKVDEFTKFLKDNGINIISEPRITGDGYYESIITDPEGNKIELTI